MNEMKMGTIRTVELEFLNERVHVKYRLSSVHSGYGPWLEAHGNERFLLMAAIERIVLEWDVEGDDGKPLPVKREIMDLWPTLFLSKILSAVLADAIPAETTEREVKLGLITGDTDAYPIPPLANLIFAARYIRVPPWELHHRVYVMGEEAWLTWGILCHNAEIQAKKGLDPVDEND